MVEVSKKDREVRSVGRLKHMYNNPAVPERI
jgi:hypothetical protein